MVHIFAVITDYFPRHGRPFHSASSLGTVFRTVYHDSSQCLKLYGYSMVALFIFVESGKSTIWHLSLIARRTDHSPLIKKPYFFLPNPCLEKEPLPATQACPCPPNQQPERHARCPGCSRQSDDSTVSSGRSQSATMRRHV